MARLTVDLELEQVRTIVRDLDRTLDPVGLARLHGGVSDVYRIDFAGAEKALVLKIYPDEPAWIVAKEALVAGWIGERAGIPIPRWLRVDERRTCAPFRFALTTWLPGMTVRSLIGAPGIDAAYRQMGELLRRRHAIPMLACCATWRRGADRRTKIRVVTNSAGATELMNLDGPVRGAGSARQEDRQFQSLR
jgi:aminoglycoside phosphotransferase